MEHINKLHIELTTRCNALCWKSLNENSKVCFHGKSIPHEISYVDLIHFLNPRVLGVLKEIKICGGLGEPTLYSKFLEFIDYIKKYSITISLSTNGDTHAPSWWENLGKKLNKEDIIYFGLDGLEKTNVIYRGTQYSRVIKNIKAVTSNSDVKVEWQYLVFKHNEKDIEEAENIAKSLRVSFDLRESGEYNAKLQKPSHKHFTEAILEENHSINDGFLFLGADGFLYPGHYTRILSNDIYYGKQVIQNTKKYLNLLKIKDKLNIKSNSFNNIKIALKDFIED